MGTQLKNEKHIANCASCKRCAIMTKALLQRMHHLFNAPGEIDCLAQRSRESMEHLKREGVQVGRAGIGWRYSEEVDAEGRKRKERVAEEWPVIERIGRLRAQGLSHRAIADTLAAEGWKTQRGGRWHGKVVRSVLMRLGNI